MYQSQIEVMVEMMDNLVSAIKVMEGRLGSMLGGMSSELIAQKQILDAIAANAGDGACWMKAADVDWEKQLFDFLDDDAQHDVNMTCVNANKSSMNRFGVVLYNCWPFFVAYHDEARFLNDLDHKATIVFRNYKSFPARSAIHVIHLPQLVRLLTSKGIMVQVMAGKTVAREKV